MNEFDKVAQTFLDVDDCRVDRICALWLVCEVAQTFLDTDDCRTWQRVIDVV